ncbi:hypothetical protein [Streptomyces harbinensis]|uniref:hypothetical protein n=1 Tax=Streptomyces harbinensis TaxID=1176198 RepID=UPI00369FA440
MATLITQTVTQAGVIVVHDPADPAGDKVRPGRGVALSVRSASETDLVVTLVTPGTIAGLEIEDREVPIPAGADVMVPIADSQLYGDPADGGLATVLYDDATDLVVAAIRI